MSQKMSSGELAEKFIEQYGDVAPNPQHYPMCFGYFVNMFMRDLKDADKETD